ncbi:hypothetical protein IIM_04101 [Bacillus cereus VD107]|nr:hypothetical protein IIM_04101 [Bacillus cereus VD107]
MKIIQVSSGLGNQMFQYALYKKISLNDNDVFLDSSTSYMMYKNQHNGYELERIFHIKPRHAGKEIIDNLSDLDSELISRIRRKLFGAKKSMYVELKEFEYDPIIFEKKETYFKGYWQNYNYFKDIEQELRKDFVFTEKLDKRNEKLANEIRNKNSVSIHIRRGDYYLNKVYEEKFGNIANLEYYLKAINLVKKKIEDPKFYIFSDDIDWAQKNINLTNDVVYISHNQGNESYKDMQLMSLCKHNIIANSTFSWWGAFLNNNDDKIVVAPKKWINIKGLEKVELFPENWITY